MQSEPIAHSAYRLLLRQLEAKGSCTLRAACYFFPLVRGKGKKSAARELLQNAFCRLSGLVASLLENEKGTSLPANSEIRS